MQLQWKHLKVQKRKVLNVKDKLLIIGASGHGKVVADVAFNMKRWNEILFLDDNQELTSVSDYKIIGQSNDVNKYINDFDLFVAIGNNKIRQSIFINLESLGASIPILIHPETVIGKNVSLGRGTVVMPGVIINTCTNIGRGCIVNTASTIDHDNEIGDFVHISPGVHLAGTVSIGKASWIGVGSSISNNVNIVANCTIGAGGVVTKDLNEQGTYVGVPVRKLKSNN